MYKKRINQFQNGVKGYVIPKEPEYEVWQKIGETAMIPMNLAQNESSHLLQNLNMEKRSGLEKSLSHNSLPISK